MSAIADDIINKVIYIYLISWLLYPVYHYSQLHNLLCTVYNIVLVTYEKFGSVEASFMATYRELVSHNDKSFQIGAMRKHV